MLNFYTAKLQVCGSMRASRWGGGGGGDGGGVLLVVVVVEMPISRSSLTDQI